MANLFTPQAKNLWLFFKFQLEYFCNQAELHATLDHCDKGQAKLTQTLIVCYLPVGKIGCLSNCPGYFCWRIWSRRRVLGRLAEGWRPGRVWQWPRWPRNHCWSLGRGWVGSRTQVQTGRRPGPWRKRLGLESLEASTSFRRPRRPWLKYSRYGH